MNALKKKTLYWIYLFQKSTIYQGRKLPPPRFSSIILDETLTLSTIS